MRTTIFKQYKDPWQGLPFPGGGTNVRGAGCGLCSVAHILIEDSRYQNFTPATIRPYMVKYAVQNQGLKHAGIPDTLRYYGMENVKEFGNSSSMKDIFAELNKGSRLGVILFYKCNSRGQTIASIGPDGTCWTGGGHFIAFTDYKIKDGKHWFYMKDSGGRDHDGYFAYENSLRGCVYKVWTCTIPKAGTSKLLTKLSVDGDWSLLTTIMSQQMLGTFADGTISQQATSDKKYCPACSKDSWQWMKSPKGGSALVKKIQKLAGAKQDGFMGTGTIKALQKFLQVKQTGYLDKETVKAWQRYVNKLIDAKNKKIRTEEAKKKAEAEAKKKAEAEAKKKAEEAKKKAEEAKKAQQDIFDKANVWVIKIANDNRYGYVFYKDAEYTHECCICNPRDRDLGGNCIWLAWATWHHGAGLPCHCSCEVINNSQADKLIRMKASEALAFVKERTGLKDVNVFRTAKYFPVENLKQGDIILFFDGLEYYHTAYYMGNGKIADARSNRGIVANVAIDNDMKADIKCVIRYTGK